MLQILVCVGLKVAELGAVLFVPFFVGPVVSRYWLREKPNRLILALIVFGIIILSAVMALPLLVDHNWAVAGDIVRLLQGE